MTTPSPVDQHPDVGEWLASFADAVRSRDYEAARTLFAPEAVGFGSVTRRYAGVDELVRDQWQDVWERTTGFDFDTADARCWVDQALILVVTDWSSVRVQPDTSPRRSGRATLGLTRAAEGLKAVHSHFSMTPGTSA